MSQPPSAHPLKVRAATAWWRGSWNGRRRWHRYSVRGLEHYDAVEGALVVGYHGRPVAHDLCMFQEWVRSQRGELTHAIMHAAAKDTPVLRHVLVGNAFLTGDGPELAAALAAGRKVIVTPGGTHEGCRPSSVRYRVDWGQRAGWVKLAIRYRVPIVPAAGWGVDDTYLGLNDGDALAKRLGTPAGLPAWVGLGPFGLWPFSPPFPVRITTVFGPPYRAHLDIDPQDRTAVARCAADVAAAVQGLLDARPRQRGGA